MFSYEEIQRYSETDLAIYKYIIGNMDKIQYMTIRELARESRSSPASVLRFCQKNGWQGYENMKTSLRELRLPSGARPSRDLQELSSFFERANSAAFEEKLAPATELIRRSNLLFFLGIGSSGTLARYGARLFSNFGKLALGLEDPYYPFTAENCRNVAALLLSISGETAEIVNAARRLQQFKCPVLSITSSSRSTLAKISDWNFSYHFESVRIQKRYNAATQVPVLFLLEALAKRMEHPVPCAGTEKRL